MNMTKNSIRILASTAPKAIPGVCKDSCATCGPHVPLSTLVEKAPPLPISPALAAAKRNGAKAELASLSRRVDRLLAEPTRSTPASRERAARIARLQVRP